MIPHVRLLVCWLIGRVVGHDVLNWREVILSYSYESNLFITMAKSKRTKKTKVIRIEVRTQQNDAFFDPKIGNLKLLITSNNPNPSCCLLLLCLVFNVSGEMKATFGR